MEQKQWYDSLLREINYQQIPYEIRVDLFNKYQIPVHKVYLSPANIVFWLATSMKDGADVVTGFSHTGNIASSVNGFLDGKFVFGKQYYETLIKDNKVVVSMPKNKKQDNGVFSYDMVSVSVSEDLSICVTTERHHWTGNDVTKTLASSVSLDKEATPYTKIINFLNDFK
jgi:hypothetical protein